MGDYVFPVLDNHPAMSRRYCELCGGEVDGHGECQSTACEGEIADLVRLVGTLSRWSLHKPLHMRVLASRIEQPHYSVREVATVVGIGRSRVHDVLRELGDSFPALAALLGFAKPTSRNQQARRKRERKATA